jgi:putative Mg2+ transporter-C (MgtC) family protein
MLLDLSLNTIGHDLLNLAIAYVVAIPIGWNREHEERSAGIRTFPIVAVASCGIALVGENLPNATGDSFSRILQGLIAGIGFIGGGAILRGKTHVQGTATAASVWNVGIIGAAIGFDMYHIGIVLGVINWMTLKLLVPLKKETDAPTSPECEQ